MLGTLAFSERGTGAHFYSPELRAERRNGSVFVSGRKAFVTSGGHADAMLVLLRVRARAWIAMWCAGMRPGYALRGAGRAWGCAGTRASPWSSRTSRSTATRASARRAVARTWSSALSRPPFWPGLAAVNVGIAQAALSCALEHAKSRRYPDGGVLVEVPTVQHALANMDIDVRAARALLQEAARMGDNSDEAALVALMEAKVLATDVAARVTQGALEVCGGQAYTAALPIERHLRDARAGAVMAPTNGVLRTWSAKAIAGLPLPMSGVELRLGAVAYHPRIVTIWERFRTVFRRRGGVDRLRPVLQLRAARRAVLDGTVDIAWNTNTAYVAIDHHAPGRTRILGMRDVDLDWATVLVMRKGKMPGSVAELSGRALALGSRDSGHAAILPLHYLAEDGLDVSSCRLLRFDTDLGKHGDTGDSELHVVRAVAEGEADAGALSAAYFSAFRAESVPALADLEVAWRSPELLPLQLHDPGFAGPKSLRRSGHGRCWRWTTAIRTCARRWTLRESDAGIREIARGTRRCGLLCESRALLS